jgi:hypothetical protein
MKNIKKEALVWVHLISLIAIWVSILYLTATPLAIDKEAIKKLPEVVTVYLILSYIFTKWLWKLRIFRGWLVPYPNLNGTWEGMLRSTWTDPATNEIPPPIKALLVIKQSFSSISCVILTAESESYSTTAQINEDDDSGMLRLSYNYLNTSRVTVRGRSQIHNGAAIVKIVSAPRKALEGQYWTDRCTTGEMEFTFKSKTQYQSFVED